MKNEETKVLILSARSQIADKGRGPGCRCKRLYGEAFSSPGAGSQDSKPDETKVYTKDVCLSYGDIRFDTKKREACANGEPVSLTRKENGILEYMLLNQGRPVSQKNLLNMYGTHL